MEAGRFYDIASRWPATADEVSAFKSHLRRLSPAFARAAGQFKVCCRQEWAMGTWIEVYVQPEGFSDLVHLKIDRSDGVSCAAEDDGDYSHECADICRFARD
jgi:hypothetical protein